MNTEKIVTGSQMEMLAAATAANKAGQRCKIGRRADGSITHVVILPSVEEKVETRPCDHAHVQVAMEYGRSQDRVREEEVAKKKLFEAFGIPYTKG